MASQILTLRAIPLTPIHIGDGTELTPDRYKIQGSELLLFDPARVLSTLPQAERARYLRMLDAGQLEEANKLLRGVATAHHITGRMAISDSSKSELQPNAERSGRVHPFVRSGGKPYIPGSSIKGALRTALLNLWSDGQVQERVRNHRNIGEKHSELVRSALNLTRDDTADDPLRFLSVGDVEIPDNATMIDRAFVIKHGRDERLEANGMQMHYERLLAASDGVVPRDRYLNVTMRLDAAGMQDVRRSTCPPGRTLDLATLHDATCGFHWGRWQAERNRFFGGEPGTCQRMDRLLKLVTVPAENKTLADVGPEHSPNYWLLRIGRFSHFESKSVDVLRQGHRPQDKLHPQLSEGREGISRTAVRIGNGQAEAFIPFGWLLLFHEAG